MASKHQWVYGRTSLPASKKLQLNTCIATITLKCFRFLRKYTLFKCMFISLDTGTKLAGVANPRSRTSSSTRTT